MQPCPNCGGVGIDQNGYCTNCHAYRGIPSAPPSSGAPYSASPYGGQPSSGPPSSGGPYGASPYGGPPSSGPPSSGGPYGGYAPNTAGPSFPDQVSAPPTVYGGAYGAPTTPPKKNNFLVPILALSGVLVLLVVAIVVVTVVRSGGDKADPGTPGVAPTNNAAKSVIDDCVVGSWETVSYTEQVAVDGVGDVPFKLQKNGAKYTFTADGKATQTFAGTTFAGNMPVEGTNVQVLLTVDATVTADVRTAGNGMTYSNVVSKGKAVVTAPSANFREEENFDPGDDPSKYTCNGDELTLTTSRIDSKLKRTG